MQTVCGPCALGDVSWRLSSHRAFCYLLIVHSLASRRYLFDLTPGNSFIDAVPVGDRTFFREDVLDPSSSAAGRPTAASAGSPPTARM